MFDFAIEELNFIDGELKDVIDAVVEFGLGWLAARRKAREAAQA